VAENGGGGGGIGEIGLWFGQGRGKATQLEARRRDRSEVSERHGGRIQVRVRDQRATKDYGRKSRDQSRYIHVVMERMPGFLKILEKAIKLWSGAIGRMIRWVKISFLQMLQVVKSLSISQTSMTLCRYINYVNHSKSAVFYQTSTLQGNETSEVRLMIFCVL